MLVDDPRPRRPRRTAPARGGGASRALASEARYRALLDQAPDAMLVIDGQGRIEVANQQACALFGYGSAELLGRVVDSLLPERMREAHRIRRAAYLAGERPLMAPGIRMPCRRQDGTEFPAEISLSASTTADGVWVTATIRDVTSRVRVETALRASEERFRRIIEAAVEGICMIDAAGLTTFVNPHMTSMLGYAPGEMIGKPLRSFTKEASRRRLGEYLDNQQRGPGANNEFQLERKDGKELWVLLATTAILDDAGCLQGALVMVADVTEQKRMQARLLVADRMVSIGTLAAGVAHEINNPLAALIGNLDLLTREVADRSDRHQVAAGDGPSDPLAAPDVRPLLRDAREAAERVRQIVRDLKVFSRPEEDARGPVDVRRTLESSLRMTWNEIRHRARLVKDYQPLPPVDANEGRLGQVFLNLIVNAAQAIPEGRADENEIRIVTRLAPDGRALIEIRDTGLGIPPDDLVHIFDPFFTTKPIGVGTGLGLAICQRIITDLGGDIWVETTAGSGSSFQVALPLHRRRAETAPPDAEPTADRPRRGRLLVVDDEPLVSGLMARALRTDHEVTVESRAEQALALISGGARFDLILCDVMMPQMTGIDLHAALLRVAPDQAARIVFITGGAFTGPAREFLARTGNGTIEKPFDVGKLRALVTERVRAEPPA